MVTEVEDPTDVERDACLYILVRSRTIVDLTHRQLLLMVVLGLITATIAIALDLGIIEFNKLKIGETEFILRNLFVIRLFFTAACFFIFLIIIFLGAQKSRAEKVVEYLAEQRKYHTASVLLDFGSWYQKTSDYKRTNNIENVMVGAFGFLLIVFPLIAFVVSLFLR